VTIEQRITQQLDSTLTDAEFDTLSAEAEAEADAEAESESYGVTITTAEPGPTFRDCRTMPSPQPAVPLDDDGRRPGVGPRCGIPGCPMSTLSSHSHGWVAP
jgi:hypothetical protein